MNTNEETTDRLASLINNDADCVSQTSKLVATIENKPIRNAFADCINARCDVLSMVGLISTMSEELTKDQFKGAIKVFSLSNSSQLRQSLEKGFLMPTSGKAGFTQTTSAGF